MKSYAVTIDLDPWRFGYVVVQEKHDGAEFSALLRAERVAEQNLKIYREQYDALKQVRGFCYVRDAQIPWLIVVFGFETQGILKTFVHEAVHLGEHLPDRHNVPLEFANQEIRARIAARAFELFYPQHFRKTSALWEDRAVWIMVGAFVVSLLWAAVKYLPSRNM
jgi:hypothetical protein